MNRRARVIALYLPQFHPIPENDRWWGKGFTEWTNAAKAKPMFRGHYQPHIPADLGFYDLRVPETRLAQAEMAGKHGIEAFCYYHYWFAGKRLLERPFDEVLRSGEPSFPFCLCWANQTWSGIWHGCPDRILMEQTYPGEDDHRAHFEYLLKAFTDPRHVTVDGKPLFLVFRPTEIPDIGRVTEIWREMAHRAGLKGLHIVWMQEPELPEHTGFDALSISRFSPDGNVTFKDDSVKWIRRELSYYQRRLLNRPKIYSYQDAVTWFMQGQKPEYTYYPCLLPNWDNTPRSNSNGFLLHGSTPELFRLQVKHALECTRGVPLERNLFVVKSWNEWAEGNHLEPDLKFGLSYLEVLRDEITR